jgi:hypothetical protein
LGVAVTPGLYGLSTSYTLLTASAISGQFAQFVSSPPPSAFLSLSGPFYDPTSVDVTVTRTPFGAVPGLTRNQAPNCVGDGCHLVLVYFGSQRGSNREILNIPKDARDAMNG